MDSTEILQDGFTSWREVGNLPYAHARSSAVNFNDNILLYGKYLLPNLLISLNINSSLIGGFSYINSSVYHNSILIFNSTTEEWSTFGTLNPGRQGHSVSPIQLSNFRSPCTF